MRSVTLSLLVLIVAVSGAAAQSDSDAPFGLNWGMNTTDARSSGIELTDFPGNNFGISYIATKLEKALADQDATVLSFGYNNKLWRILVVSREFTNDPHGNNVLERYRELSRVLSEKYGKPKEHHRRGDSIYAESAYFIAGIRSGRTSWFSNFDSPNLSIQLGVTASHSSTSRWRLIYENKGFKREFDSSKRAREKGAL